MTSSDTGALVPALRALEAEWRTSAEKLRDTVADTGLWAGKSQSYATCADDLAALLHAAETLPSETRQCEFRSSYGQRCIHRVGHAEEHACYGYQDPAFIKPPPSPETAAHHCESVPCPVCHPTEYEAAGALSPETAAEKSRGNAK